jgi:hypothetical protein
MVMAAAGAATGMFLCLSLVPRSQSLRFFCVLFFSLLFICSWIIIFNSLLQMIMMMMLLLSFAWCFVCLILFALLWNP